MTESVNTQQSSVGWKYMLMARPVQNTAVRVEHKRPNSVIIHVKRKKPWYMAPPLSWIIPARPTQALTLDAIGSEIWGLCNGQRTVEDVVDIFALRYRLSFHEARISVTEYLKTLIQRSVLAIAMQTENEDNIDKDAE